MIRYSLLMKPDPLVHLRKKGTIYATFLTEPFEIDTQEGVMVIGPDTVDGWDDGYFLVYPDDGSKPYAIAPAFLRKNYASVDPREENG